MNVDEFDFDLPDSLIAQNPAGERGESRLLVLQRSGVFEHTTFSRLAHYVVPGDVLVVNDTRVFPARLLGRRVPSGGAVECLLIQRVDLGSDPSQTEVRPRSDPAFVFPRKISTWVRPGSDLGQTSGFWEALVHPGQKLKPGARVVFEGNHTIHGEILERRFFGRRLLRLWTEDGSPLDEAVDAIGHIPLPPYIKRDDRLEDRDRYQTVFAHSRGSIAAPTAGLHFTPQLVTALADRGIELTSITLHVGYGTFQPVRVARVED